MILGEFSGFVFGAPAMWVLLPAELRNPLGLVLLGGSAVASSLAVRWVFDHVDAR
jgi:hypothetical protein